MEQSSSWPVSAQLQNSPPSTKDYTRISEGIRAGPAEQVNGITVIFQRDRKEQEGWDAAETVQSCAAELMWSVKACSLLMGLRALPGEEFKPALLESFVLIQSQHQKVPF